MNITQNNNTQFSAQALKGRKIKTMKTDIDSHEDQLASDDPEYRRRLRDAASAYAAEEIEAWQLACAEGLSAAVIDGTSGRAAVRDRISGGTVGDQLAGHQNAGSGNGLTA